MGDLITFKPFYPKVCNIVNRTLVPQDDDKVRLEVPHRANHFNRKRFIEDWRFRTIIEHKYSARCFFVTLTFDDYYLPRMSDGRPCFCVDYVTNFFKVLRKHLSECSVNYVNTSVRVFKGSLRYFLCSEYGKNTLRPHHHALFFLDDDISCKDFRDLVKRAWPYGFIDCEIPHETKVLSYVSKYVAKDMYGFGIDTSSLNDHEKEVRTVFVPKKYLKYGAPAPIPYDELPNKLKLGRVINESFSEDFLTGKQFKRTFTTYNFHRQSLGYGSRFEDEVTEEDLKKGTFTVVLGGQPNVFRIPEYYIRRLCYDIEYIDLNGEEHQHYKVNELGKQVREARCNKFVDNFLDTLKEYELNSDSIAENTGYVLEPDDLQVSTYYRLGILDGYIPYYSDPEADFRYFICNVRERRYMHRLAAVDHDHYRYKYNIYYEQLLRVVGEVSDVINRRKQRSDEINEYSNLIKHRTYGRCY